MKSDIEHNHIFYPKFCVGESLYVETRSIDIIFLKWKPIFEVKYRWSLLSGISLSL